MKNIKELGLELIELDDQVLLVEKNREYQTNGWAFNTGKGVFWVDMSDRYPSGYKFIASTKPLEGLPLLVIEDEVEELIDQEMIKMGHEPKRVRSVMYGEDRELAKALYNKVKSTYKFTEEDLRRAIKMSKVTQKYKYGEGRVFVNSDESIIQSLTKKELWIEVEYDYEEHPELVGNPKEEWYLPKIINNQIKGIYR